MKNKFEIRGDKVAIFLKRRDGKDLETIISLSDLPKAQEFPRSWCAMFGKNTGTFYVQSVLNNPNNKSKRVTVMLHRWLLNPDKNMLVDHINHDTLDNTRENLRIVTLSENMHNQKGAQKDNTSGILGVSWNNLLKKWKAQIQVNKVKYNLGHFDNKEEAAEAVKEARIKYM